jgi:signal transduction histidine kinase
MRSIRRHLGVVLCTSVGVVLLLTGVAVFISMRQLLYFQFDETLTAKSRALITASEIDDDEFEIDLTVQDFAGFGSGGEDYFEIRRLSGELFLSSPSLDLYPDGLWAAQAHPPPGDDEPAINSGNFSDRRGARFYRQRFYPKDDDELEHQDLYLIVASPDGSMRAQLAGLGIILAIAGAAALLLIIPAIRISLGRGLKPLNRLAADVVAIDPGSLRTRLEPGDYPEELTPVAARLNEWIGQLEATFARERRFSANAAHELRTPLAELRAMADLRAAWPEEATPEHCREMVDAIAELEALLEKLTLLSRAEAGRHVSQAEEIDLAASIAQAFARHESRAEARRLDMVADVTPGPFAADPVLWNAILHNLLGNAVAHAPEGAKVTVTASPTGVSVSNLAPDLAVGDVSLMFEPFWRGDHARTNHEHAGLGLSIVKACADLMGGHGFSRMEQGMLHVGVEWK